MLKLLLGIISVFSAVSVATAQMPVNADSLKVKTITSTGTLTVVSGNSAVPVTINGAQVTTGISYGAFLAVSNKIDEAYTLATNTISRSTGGVQNGSITFSNSSLLSVDTVDFDLTPTNATAVGRLAWNPTYGTLNFLLSGGNIDLEIGEKLVTYARNSDTSTLNIGEAVILNSSVGDNATIRRASYTSNGLSAHTIGIVGETIALGASGFVVTRGRVRMNTTAFDAGVSLWLGLNGGVQTNRPVAPLHAVFLGIVEKRAGGQGGIVYVQVQNGFELNELHNVYINGVVSNQILAYNAVSSRWENTSISNLNILTKSEFNVYTNNEKNVVYPHTVSLVVTNQWNIDLVANSNYPALYYTIIGTITSVDVSAKSGTISFADVTFFSGTNTIDWKSSSGSTNNFKWINSTNPILSQTKTNIITLRSQGTRTWATYIGDL